MNEIKSYDEYLTRLVSPNPSFYYVYDKRDNFSAGGKKLLDEFVVGYKGADFYSIEMSEYPDIPKKLMISGTPSIFFGKGGRREPTCRFAASNSQIIIFKVKSDFAKRGIELKI